MAVVQPVRTPSNNGKTVLVTWTNVTTADTGAAAELGDLDELTFQVTSAGSGTAQLRISNDGVNFVGLTAVLALGTPAPVVVGFAFPTPGLSPRMWDISAVATATVTVTVEGKLRDM